MTRARTLAAILAAASLASLTGCANMTPEERQRMAAGVAAGLAAGAAYGAAAAPRYYAPPPPVYVAPPTFTRCTRWGNSINCNSW